MNPHKQVDSHFLNTMPDLMPTQCQIDLLEENFSEMRNKIRKFASNKVDLNILAILVWPESVIYFGLVLCRTNARVATASSS